MPPAITFFTTSEERVIVTREMSLSKNDEKRKHIFHQINSVRTGLIVLTAVWYEGPHSFETNALTIHIRG